MYRISPNIPKILAAVKPDEVVTELQIKGRLPIGLHHRLRFYLGRLWAMEILLRDPDYKKKYKYRLAKDWEAKLAKYAIKPEKVPKVPKPVHVTPVPIVRPGIHTTWRPMA